MNSRLSVQFTAFTVVGVCIMTGVIIYGAEESESLLGYSFFMCALAGGLTFFAAAVLYVDARNKRNESSDAAVGTARQTEGPSTSGPQLQQCPQAPVMISGQYGLQSCQPPYAPYHQPGKQVAYPPPPGYHGAEVKETPFYGR